MPLPTMGNPYATQGYLNKLKMQVRQLVGRSEAFTKLYADDTEEARECLRLLLRHIEKTKELLK